MKNTLLLFIVISFLLSAGELYGANLSFKADISEQFCLSMPPALIRPAYSPKSKVNSDIEGVDSGLLNISNRLSLAKRFSGGKTLISARDILMQERCHSLAYQHVDIGQAKPINQNWFTRFWVKTDYVSERTFPARMGHDQFIWTVKESEFKRSSLDLVVTCQYPVEGYVHSRLAGGSWMLGPQFTFSGKKTRR